MATLFLIVSCIIAVLILVVVIADFIPDQKREQRELFRKDPIGFLQKNQIREDIIVVDVEGIPQGTYGRILMNHVGLRIITDHTDKRIGYNSINAASMCELDRISKDKKFSTGKAVAGTLLFGAVGGAIGGFGNKKDVILKGLSISYYNDNGELNYATIAPRYLGDDKESQIHDKEKKLNAFRNDLMLVVSKSS